MTAETAKKAREIPISLDELKQQMTYKVVCISEVKEDKIKGEVEISPYKIDLGEEYPVGPLISLDRSRLSYKRRHIRVEVRKKMQVIFGCSP